MWAVVEKRMVVLFVFLFSVVDHQRVKEKKVWSYKRRQRATQV